MQDPVRLGSASKPEPDLLGCRLPQGAPPEVPDGGDTLLVVEVADSSLWHARETKLPLYRRAGIPEPWLGDLVNGRIERHTEPGPAGYRLIAVAHPAESPPSMVLPGFAIAAADLLP